MMKNVLKFLSFSVMLAVLLFTTSCGEDDTVVVPADTDLPTISIAAPAAGSIVVAGSQVASSITIADNTEISTVSITVGNGTVTIIDVNNTDIGSDAFSFSDNLAIPTDVVLGEHTVTVTVVDAAGNTASATVAINAYPVYTDGQTTILVTSVPDQVTDYSGDNTIRMVGSHQDPQWDVASDSHPLTAYTDSEGTTSYYQQIANTGAEFKFVRGLDWPMVQKDADGKESSNNSSAADATLAEYTIGSWRDYNPEISNNSSATFIAINGVIADGTYTISGNVGTAITTSSAIASVAYSIVDGSDAEIASGALTIDANGDYSEVLDVSSYALDTYSVRVTATDAAGNSGREDETLILVEFPCDDSGETAVAATMTRVIINIPTNVGTRDMYVTGNVNGAGIWGTIATEYKMIKLSDGCYYIDLVLAAGDQLQFFYEEPANVTSGDWWRGAATRVAGDGNTAAEDIDAASNGNTIKAFYGAWREDPPS